MAPHTLEAEFLFTLRATTDTPHAVGRGPKGNRLIVAVTGGDFSGPRMRGRVAPPGGDWVTLQSGGFARLDVRLQLVTDDGAEILMTYGGVGQPGADGGLDIRTAPTFETGDERYAWLNTLQAVGVGKTVPGGVEYEIYRIL